MTPSIHIPWKDLGLVPSTEFWHMFESGVSGNEVIADYSGNGRNIDTPVLNSPVIQLNVVNGQPAWYFDGSTTTPLATAAATSVPLRHYFVLAAHDGATFDLNRGLLTGKTTTTILASNNSGTTFFNLGLGAGFEYRKSNVLYAEANQQAPMVNFELIEVALPIGTTIDGIQVGKQTNIAGRIWKGWFVDHMGFDSILSESDRRRVLLYYSLRYGVHLGTQIPLIFPSKDIVGGDAIHNRFNELPRDWDEITEDYQFEDANKTFNEFGDDPPRRWEYKYVNVSKTQAILFDLFNDTARKVNPFYFKDPEGYVWNNVRIDNYSRTHEAHKRWVHEVNFNLIGYRSESVFEG